MTHFIFGLIVLFIASIIFNHLNPWAAWVFIGVFAVVLYFSLTKRTQK